MTFKLKIFVICCLLFLFQAKLVFADSPLNIGYTKESYKQLSVMVQGWEYPSEVSPIVLTNPNGKRLYILSGGNSHICQSDGNMLSQDVVIPVSNCRVDATKNVLTSTANDNKSIWLNPADIADEMVRYPWRFSYDGIFTATVNPVTNKIFFGRYFEHQNYVYRYPKNYRDCDNIDPDDYYLYRSNMHPNVSSDYCTCEQQSYVCKSWTDPNPLCIHGNNICPADLSGAEHDHSYPSMAVGATMGWADFSPTAGYQLSEVHDEGPIIWPQQAYRANGENIYRDVAPGESIIRDGYIYFFYTMKPRGQQNNNASCFGLARSKLEDNGLPGTWKNYYQGSFGPNTLPSGFDKSRISEFYELKGGAADCVLPIKKEYPDQGVATWINVAKFKDLPYYISVEETSPQWRRYQMGVRFSSDLINWTELYIIEAKDTVWGDSNYTYPRFLNKEGTSNKEIDPDEFYLYGKRTGAGGYTIQSLKMSLILRPQEDKVESVIQHYFNQFLKRNSSNLTYHKDMMDDSGCKGVIKDITSGVEFDSGYKSTATDEKYIHILFRAILARKVSDSDGGYQWWLANLKNGNYNRDTIVDALVKISEAQNACIAGKTLSLPVFIKGDINKDGIVNIIDLRKLINVFASNNQPADLNGDGKVNVYDYVILIANYGKSQ